MTGILKYRSFTSVLIFEMNEHKVWLVTGSSGGLGRAVVEHVLLQGSKVVATCRKTSGLDDLVAKYPLSQLVVVRLDVTIASEITAAFACAIEAFGRIDVVYNNAGFMTMAEIEGTTEEYARSIFEVNFWGAANVSREAVRVFRDVNSPPGGRLLQALSRGGIQAVPGVGYYCATKFALEGLSECLQSEVHPSWNIKITHLQLGSFTTRIFNPATESLVVLPQHPAYNQPDNKARLSREWMEPGRQVHGDPNKAAREIYKIASNNDVGLRVVVGQDALAAANEKLVELQEYIRNSEEFSTDLKFDS
ncbi:hypothetical protein D9619_000098 [Psilocybe cf. subviscida]|uniref:NAD(P)-binding protein n=1 Tax=Psilocybe cf. subviscida TaxID=2480587 RepID=A0A8H5BG59_9AGAR|nr:hypothetical protein D9619_000098 [Psilocybe cf. subviscida]